MAIHPEPFQTMVGHITNDDLNKVDNAEFKYFEFVTRLQLRYKLDLQATKDEIDKRVAEYEAYLK